MLFSVILGLMLFEKMCVASDLDFVLEKLQDLETRLEKQERINVEQQQVIDQQQLTIQQQQQLISRLEARINIQDKEIVKLKDIRQTTQILNRCGNCAYEKSSNTSKYRQHTRKTQPSRRMQLPEHAAFTAYLDHNVEHLTIDHPIVYNRVIQNKGTTYNPNTGIFTCPLDGLYGFYFSIATYGVHEAVAKLVVDGVNQVDAITDSIQEQHNAQGANFAILSLKQGQQVWVASYNGLGQSIDNGDSFRFSTFSGFLLF